MSNQDGAIRDAKTLGVPRMLILGLQHMFAMFGATILVPILVNTYFLDATGEPLTRGLTVSITLFCAGFGTLLFHVCAKMKVPAFLGSSFAFLGGFSTVAHLSNGMYAEMPVFPKERFLEAVDKVDSGNLTIDEVMNPTGWILIGFLMDPRTGLGRWRNFTISNYQLMEKLIDACRTMSTEEILALPDVKERIEVYFEQTEKFKEMVKAHTTVSGNLIISDLRGVDPIYSGNRFMIYSMYPEQNISAWVVSGRGGQGCSAAVGYSIMNRTCTIDVGALMLKYGGGGHKKVGTCQFSNENMDTELPKMLEELKTLSNN